MQPANNPAPNAAPNIRSRNELLVFLLLTVVVWPIAAVGIVGFYGFTVWMQQQIFGPPHMVDPSHAR